MQLKKNDLILIGIVLVVAVIIFIVYLFFMPSESGAYVKVSFSGDIINEYPLSKSKTIPLEFNGHKNVLKIEDGIAFMIEADCNDQICVNHKPIDLSGQQIVCLPNKIVVEVFGTEKDKYDIDM